MNKIYLGIGAVAFVAIAAFALTPGSTTKSATMLDRNADEKIYVALEGEGKIAVIDAVQNRLLRTIDLTQERDGTMVRFMAHNVQVAPDGSSVAVTANVEEDMEGMEKDAHDDAEMQHGVVPDELVMIDPRTDTIVRRIPIESDSHLAHVVFEKGSKTALVTLQEKGKVYQVDTVDGRILRKTDLGKESGPHGLRMTPDGSKAYIALLSGKGVAIESAASGEAEIKKLPGAAVQTAVTPDGALAFASLYDTKQVAWFDVQSGGQGFISLPEGSRGPVQLYPSPNSRYLYVVDQGYYFDQPTGNTIYRINVATKAVDATIAGGAAPHGVVVSNDGSRLYVTNLLGNDLSVVDTASNKEIARIPVGKMPNGVSIWNANTGGTP